MIFYKTKAEIEKIKTSSRIVSQALAEVARHISPGITTLKLDQIAEDFIKSQNAIPAFKGFKNFPSSLCISVNEEVVHGMPGNRELKEGDIVSVDCGVVFDSFYGDSAYTFPVGEIDEKTARLVQVTRDSLYKGIEAAQVGNRMGDVSYSIQQLVEANGFSVVRELVGHGIGKSLHEDPEVPNYGKKGSGIRILEGLVIAIEPMVNMGKKEVVQAADGWTIYAEDRLPSAHFEHTIAITGNGPVLLTTFEFIEEVIKTAV